MKVYWPDSPTYFLGRYGRWKMVGVEVRGLGGEITMVPVTTRGTTNGAFLRIPKDAAREVARAILERIAEEEEEKEEKK